MYKKLVYLLYDRSQFVRWKGAWLYFLREIQILRVQSHNLVALKLMVTEI